MTEKKLNELISVIVTVHSVKKYLKKCLESIVSQTHRALEIIIVDDGSPDNSAKIYSEYARRDERIKIIRQRNKGVAAARNAGLAAATGKYVHFIDGDDYLAGKDYYVKMLTAALKAGSDITVSGFRWQAKRKTIGTKRLKTVKEMPGKIKVMNEYPAVWRYLFNKSFLDFQRIRFDQVLRGAGGEDSIFALQALYFANKLTLVPETVYFYRKNPNSICNTKCLKRIKQLESNNVYAQKKLYKFAETYQFSLANLNRWFVPEHLMTAR